MVSFRILLFTLAVGAGEMEDHRLHVISPAERRPGDRLADQSNNLR